MHVYPARAPERRPCYMDWTQLWLSSKNGKLLARWQNLQRCVCCGERIVVGKADPKVVDGVYLCPAALELERHAYPPRQPQMANPQLLQLADKLMMLCKLLCVDSNAHHEVAAGLQLQPAEIQVCGGLQMQGHVNFQGRVMEVWADELYTSAVQVQVDAFQVLLVCNDMEPSTGHLRIRACILITEGNMQVFQSWRERAGHWTLLRGENKLGVSDLRMLIKVACLCTTKPAPASLSCITLISSLTAPVLLLTSVWLWQVSAVSKKLGLAAAAIISSSEGLDLTSGTIQQLDSASSWAGPP